MRVQIITLLIILSFVAPSIHFIEYQHSYNPFTHKLEHSKSTVKQEKLNKSKSNQIKENKNNKSETEVCTTKLNNEVYKTSYLTPLVINNLVNQYIYSSNFLIKKIKSNKVLFIAPKNSPPYFA